MPARCQTDSHESVVPPFARVLNVSLGIEKESKLEEILGKGGVIVGGHSNSGRIWDFKNSLQLIADGFDLSDNKKEYILDSLSFSDWRGRLGDTKELAKFDLGIWSDLQTGMTRKECRQALPKDLSKPIATKDELIWKQDVEGKRADKDGAFHYEATLHFTGAKLERLLIDVYFEEK